MAQELILNASLQNKSFFLQVNFASPHPPFIITQSLNKSVINNTYPSALNSSIPPNDIQTIRADYK